MRGEKLYYYLAALVSIFHRIFREDRNKLSYRTLVTVIGKSVGNINGELFALCFRKGSKRRSGVINSVRNIEISHGKSRLFLLHFRKAQKIFQQTVEPCYLIFYACCPLVWL